MATSDFPFQGSFGAYSIYKMRGTEKMVIRLKAGPSAEKIMKDPKFQASRNQQKQFGIGSTIAKMIRDAMFSITHLADFPLHGHLVKLNTALMDLDTTNVRGKRSIIFSNGLHLFDGLSINRKITFDSVVTTTIVYALDRNECKATLQLPALSNGLNFNPAWNYPFFRLRINLGIVRDMTFVTGNGYEAITPDPNDQAVGFDTDWAPVKMLYPSQQVELKLENPVFDTNCHLLLSIGIEFGTQSKGTIQHVKYAGCGKILAMG